LTPQVEILHVHDWAPALVPVFVHAHGLPFSTVLTIHHVADQGSFWGLDFQLTNLPERFFTLHGIEFFGRLNFLKGGILYADRTTTVSEHYRREILAPAGGCGLDEVLRGNAHRLSAILNGACSHSQKISNEVCLPKRLRRESGALDSGRHGHQPDSIALRTGRLGRDVQLEVRRAAGRARDRWNSGDHRRLRSEHGQRL